MTAALFTAGPWAWDESRWTLRPLNPDPSRSAVHTILGPDGPVGFLGSDHRATLAEAEGNFRLIELAPQLLMALQACVACMKAPQLFSRRHKADALAEAEQLLGCVLVGQLAPQDRVSPQEALKMGADSLDMARRVLGLYGPTLEAITAHLVQFIGMVGDPTAAKALNDGLALMAQRIDVLSQMAGRAGFFPVAVLLADPAFKVSDEDRKALELVRQTQQMLMAAEGGAR